VDLFKFGLSLWAAVAVNFEAMITLKFFDGGLEGIRVGAVEIAREISKIVQARDLAGKFVDGIEMADFDGDYFVREGGLITANGEKGFR
jgi:hypothetical protein